MEDASFWRTLAITCAAFGQTMFIGLYTLFPWWNDPLGRALFFKALSIAILLDLALLSRVVDMPMEDTLFTFLYFAFAVGVWVQAFTFLRIQWRGERRDRT